MCTETRLPFLSTVLILFLSLPLAIAQKDDWASYLEAGNKAYNRSEYMQAYGHYSQAATAVLRSGIRDNDPRVVQVFDGMGKSLFGMGSDEMTRGNYSLAEDRYKDALDVLKKVRGPNDIMLGRLHHNLAIALMAQNKKLEANEAFQEAEGIFTKTDSHEDLARVLTEHATFSIDSIKDYSAAEVLYKRAQTAWNKTPTLKDPAGKAKTLHRLASLYKWQKKYTAAEPLYKEALSAQQKAAGDDATVAAMLADLADLYRKQGKHELARPLDARAKQIREKRN
jgi:tetratricopeptide (TPR) repeat protein